jgi:AcrR family transcriptional regulator
MPRASLPVDGAAPERPERADAAANRQRVLRAAAEVFATRDPRDITMGELAEAAGVGRATLYRRFPSVSAVAEALLDEHERALQEALISGPAPLGPGAPPADRLAAFYRAMTDLLELHAPLVLGTEVGSSRYRTGAYQFWRAHVAALLREHGSSPHDTALADILLAPLAPDLFLELRGSGSTPSEIAGRLEELARRVLG